MNRAIIIVAPQGAGKTQHAQALKAKLGCTHIVDEWDGRSPLKPGDLALTNLSLAPAPAGVQVMTLEEALALPQVA